MNQDQDQVPALAALDTALGELRALHAEYPEMDWAVREVTATRDALIRLFNE